MQKLLKPIFLQSSVERWHVGHERSR